MTGGGAIEFKIMKGRIRNAGTQVGADLKSLRGSKDAVDRQAEWNVYSSAATAALASLNAMPFTNFVGFARALKGVFDLIDKDLVNKSPLFTAENVDYRLRVYERWKQLTDKVHAEYGDSDFADALQLVSPLQEHADKKMVLSMRNVLTSIANSGVTAKPAPAFLRSVAHILYGAFDDFQPSYKEQLEQTGTSQKQPAVEAVAPASAPTRSAPFADIMASQGAEAEAGKVEAIRKAYPDGQRPYSNANRAEGRRISEFMLDPSLVLQGKDALGAAAEQRAAALAEKTRVAQAEDAAQMEAVRQLAAADRAKKVAGIQEASARREAEEEARNAANNANRAKRRLDAEALAHKAEQEEKEWNDAERRKKSEAAEAAQAARIESRRAGFEGTGGPDEVDSSELPEGMAARRSGQPPAEVWAAPAPVENPGPAGPPPAAALPQRLSETAERGGQWAVQTGKLPEEAVILNGASEAAAAAPVVGATMGRQTVASSADANAAAAKAAAVSELGASTPLPSAVAATVPVAKPASAPAAGPSQATRLAASLGAEPPLPASIPNPMGVLYAARRAGAADAPVRPGALLQQLQNGLDSTRETEERERQRAGALQAELQNIRTSDVRDGRLLHAADSTAALERLVKLSADQSEAEARLVELAGVRERLQQAHDQLAASAAAYAAAPKGVDSLPAQRDLTLKMDAAKSLLRTDRPTPALLAPAVEAPLRALAQARKVALEVRARVARAGNADVSSPAVMSLSQEFHALRGAYEALQIAIAGLRAALQALGQPAATEALHLEGPEALLDELRGVAGAIAARQLPYMSALVVALTEATLSGAEAVPLSQGAGDGRTSVPVEELSSALEQGADTLQAAAVARLGQRALLQKSEAVQEAERIVAGVQLLRNLRKNRDKPLELALQDAAAALQTAAERWAAAASSAATDVPAARAARDALVQAVTQLRGLGVVAQGALGAQALASSAALAQQQRLQATVARALEEAEQVVTTAAVPATESVNKAAELCERAMYTDVDLLDVEAEKKTLARAAEALRGVAPAEALGAAAAGVAEAAGLPSVAGLASASERAAAACEALRATLKQSAEAYVHSASNSLTLADAQMNNAKDVVARSGDVGPLLLLCDPKAVLALEVRFLGVREVLAEVQRRVDFQRGAVAALGAGAEAAAEPVATRLRDAFARSARLQSDQLNSMLQGLQDLQVAANKAREAGITRATVEVAFRTGGAGRDAFLQGVRALFAMRIVKDPATVSATTVLSERVRALTPATAANAASAEKLNAAWGAAAQVAQTVAAHELGELQQRAERARAVAVSRVQAVAAALKDVHDLLVGVLDGGVDKVLQAVLERLDPGPLSTALEEAGVQREDFTAALRNLLLAGEAGQDVQARLAPPFADAVLRVMLAAARVRGGNGVRATRRADVAADVLEALRGAAQSARQPGSASDEDDFMAAFAKAEPAQGGMAGRVRAALAAVAGARGAEAQGERQDAATAAALAALRATGVVTRRAMEAARAQLTASDDDALRRAGRQRLLMDLVHTAVLVNEQARRFYEVVHGAGERLNAEAAALPPLKAVLAGRQWLRAHVGMFVSRAAELDAALLAAQAARRQTLDQWTLLMGEGSQASAIIDSSGAQGWADLAATLQQARARMRWAAALPECAAPRPPALAADAAFCSTRSGFFAAWTEAAEGEAGAHGDNVRNARARAGLAQQFDARAEGAQKALALFQAALQSLTGLLGTLEGSETMRAQVSGGEDTEFEDTEFGEENNSSSGSGESSVEDEEEGGPPTPAAPDDTANDSAAIAAELQLRTQGVKQAFLVVQDEYTKAQALLAARNHMAHMLEAQHKQLYTLTAQVQTAQGAHDEAVRRAEEVLGRLAQRGALKNRELLTARAIAAAHAVRGALLNLLKPMRGGTSAADAPGSDRGPLPSLSALLGKATASLQVKAAFSKFMATLTTVGVLARSAAGRSTGPTQGDFYGVSTAGPPADAAAGARPPAPAPAQDCCSQVVQLQARVESLEKRVEEAVKGTESVRSDARELSLQAGASAVRAVKPASTAEGAVQALLKPGQAPSVAAQQGAPQPATPQGAPQPPAQPPPTQQPPAQQPPTPQGSWLTQTFGKVTGLVKRAAPALEPAAPKTVRPDEPVTRQNFLDLQSREDFRRQYRAFQAKWALAAQEPSKTPEEAAHAKRLHEATQFAVNFMAKAMKYPQALHEEHHQVSAHFVYDYLRQLATARPDEKYMEERFQGFLQAKRLRAAR